MKPCWGNFRSSIWAKAPEQNQNTVQKYWGGPPYGPAALLHKLPGVTSVAKLRAQVHKHNRNDNPICETAFSLPPVFAKKTLAAVANKRMAHNFTATLKWPLPPEFQSWGDAIFLLHALGSVASDYQH